MQLTYDELTDTLYVYYSQEAVARSHEVSERIIVDYDALGSVRGVEILDATQEPEIAFNELPRPEDFSRVVQRTRNIAVPA